MTPRDSHYAALFALLQGAQTTPALRTLDRRLRFLEGMPAAELPALFLAVDHQTTTRRDGLPAKRTLGAKVFLYAATPDRHTAAGIVLNGLIDGVEQALEPPAGSDVQTLGGLVAHCWIEGPIEVFEGLSGERSAAIVTVQMLVP